MAVVGREEIAEREDAVDVEETDFSLSGVRLEEEDVFEAREVLLRCLSADEGRWRSAEGGRRSTEEERRSAEGGRRSAEGGRRGTGDLYLSAEGGRRSEEGDLYRSVEVLRDRSVDGGLCLSIEDDLARALFFLSRTYPY